MKTFWRFLLSGGFNTIVTYGLYLSLIQFLNYNVSYTISFVMGIMLSYCLNRIYVFQTTGTVFTLTLFPLIYLFQFLLGLGIVMFWVEYLGWNQKIAPLIAVGLTVPVTYILSRYIFIKQSQ